MTETVEWKVDFLIGNQLQYTNIEWNFCKEIMKELHKYEAVLLDYKES